MPKLMQTDDMQVLQVPGAGNFQFSAIRPDKLGATEYTLVTMVVDISGSVQDFESQLLKMAQTVVDACKKNQRAENLMVRFVTFSDKVQEVHGFKPVNEIDPNDYKSLDPYGMTALFDATYSAIGATLAYGEVLTNQDFDVNAAIYIITDGDNNRGTMTPNTIKTLLKKVQKEENLESLITVLVGIKDPAVTGDGWALAVGKKLEDFKNKAGLTQYIDAGDATSQKLAKLANFVSQSISSQSQSLGTGGPSQQLKF
jgi:uncharacterized protein YegL